MRATRQTALSGEFPLHVVCAWLGNSAPIAQKHYLQVTEQHVAEAISGGAKSGALSAKRGAQNQAQHSAAPSRSHPLKTKTARKNRAALPIGAIHSELLQSHPVPRRGVELTQTSSGKTYVTDLAGAKSGALFDETLSSDPILSDLITLWPQLAASVREALLQQATESLTRGP